FQVAVPAIRAFNELGRYDDSCEALTLADLPGSNYGKDALETIFLSYFALLGQEDELNQVLASMATSKGALPEHARLYWQGRCYAERKEYEKAIRMYAESLRKTPEKDAAWRERTQYQLQENQQKLLEGPPLIDEKQQEERARAGKIG